MNCQTKCASNLHLINCTSDQLAIERPQNEVLPKSQNEPMFRTVVFNPPPKKNFGLIPVFLMHVADHSFYTLFFIAEAPGPECRT